MNVAILGGLDRLKQNYQQQGRAMGFNVRVFSHRVPNMAQRLNEVQGLVIFTGTIAHPMVVEASRLAKRRGIPIQRSHTSGISGFKRCLSQIGCLGRPS